MERDLLSTVKREIKHWWVSLIIGILSVAFGIWCFLTPISTFLALTIVFIAGFFLYGIFEIVFALNNRDRIHGWGWNLAVGIVDIIFGIILLANPALAPEILAYFIAFWLMFQSIWGIGIAIDMRKYKNSGWGWLLAFAILGLGLSVLLLIQPLITGILAASFFAALFIIYGVFRIILAFRLRSLHKFIE